MLVCHWCSKPIERGKSFYRYKSVVYHPDCHARFTKNRAITALPHPKKGEKRDDL